MISNLVQSYTNMNYFPRGKKKVQLFDLQLKLGRKPVAIIFNYVEEYPER